MVRAKNKKAFYMPGGKPDKDENTILALIREIKEEIGLDLIMSKLRKKMGLIYPVIKN